MTRDYFYGSTFLVTPLSTTHSLNPFFWAMQGSATQWQEECQCSFLIWLGNSCEKPETHHDLQRWCQQTVSFSWDRLKMFHPNQKKDEDKKVMTDNTTIFIFWKSSSKCNLIFWAFLNIKNSFIKKQILFFSVYNGCSDLFVYVSQSPKLKAI